MTSQELYALYALSAPRATAEGDALDGSRASDGAAVTVHRLDRMDPHARAALLARVAALGPSREGPVVATHTVDGSTAVVTLATPPDATLAGWMDAHAAGMPQETGASPAQGAGDGGPGEFTRLFSAPSAAAMPTPQATPAVRSSPTFAPPTPTPPATPPPAPASAAGAELPSFTALFTAPAAAADTPAAPPTDAPSTEALSTDALPTDAPAPETASEAAAARPDGESAAAPPAEPPAIRIALKLPTAPTPEAAPPPAAAAAAPAPSAEDVVDPDAATVILSAFTAPPAPTPPAPTPPAPTPPATPATHADPMPAAVAPPEPVAAEPPDVGGFTALFGAATTTPPGGVAPTAGTIATAPAGPVPPPPGPSEPRSGNTDAGAAAPGDFTRLFLSQSAAGHTPTPTRHPPRRSRARLRAGWEGGCRRSPRAAWRWRPALPPRCASACARRPPRRHRPRTSARPLHREAPRE